jgi:hypothetical protein
MTRKWDEFRAEYADTVRSAQSARKQRPCKYCGKMTRALSRICCDHEDLPAFEGNHLMRRPARETDYF